MLSKDQNHNILQLLLPLLLLFFLLDLKAQTRLIDSLRVELRQSNPDTQQVRIANRLALAMKHISADTALHILQKAQSLAQQLDDQQGQIDLLRTKAEILNVNGQGRKALTTLDSARTIAESLSNLSVLSDVIRKISNTYNFQEKRQEAITYGLEALSLAVEIEDQYRQFWILNDLGKFHMWGTQFEEAQNFFQQALDLQLTANNKNYQAGILLNMGNNASDANQVDRAIEFYQRSLQLRIELENQRAQGVLLSLIAEHYLKVGAYALALEFNQKSQTIAEQIDDKAILSHVLQGIVKIYQGMGDFDQAYIVLQQALAKRLEWGQDKIASLQDIGQHFFLQERYDSALYYFYQVLPLLKNSASKRTELARIYHLIGKTQEKKLELDSAAFYLERALRLSRETTNLELQGLSLLGIGQTLSLRGQLTEARGVYEEAYQLSRRSGYKEQELKAAEALYSISKRNNEFQKALRFYEIHQQIQQDLFSEKNVREIIRLEANNRFEKEKQALQFEQERKLSRQRSLQYAIAIALGVSLLIILAIAWYYRQKQKANTALQELNEKISQQNRQLAELDQLKSQFFTNISHELRTPLTIINGMAGQIVQSPERWLQKGTAMIRRNSANLLNLINQILDLRKLERGSMQVDNIQGDIILYLRYLLESFHVLAESKEITIHFLPFSESMIMDFDKEKVRQIFSNLLSNAIKFTPAQGSIYVRIEIDLLEDQEIPQFCIWVRDTGIGIPQEKLPHIFDRFFQVDSSPEGPGTRKSKGSGVGLSLVKELVLLMGGTIQVSSDPGEGTTFKVYLPISHEAPVQEKDDLIQLESTIFPVSPPLEVPPVEMPDSVEETITNRPHLLIVEDNPDVAQYLQSLLEEQYQLQFAEDGEEGIDMALASIPDLIISDVMMPFKDGFELCHTLKTEETTSHIPIILLTSREDEESKIAGLHRGADAYLTKPFNPKELFVRLKKLLDLRKQLQARYAQLDLSSPPTQAAFKQEDVFIKKVRQVIEENLDDENFSIAALCRQVHMSRSQLHLKVKALTSRSTSHFIRAVRLHKAKEFLHKTDWNITEVAMAVGYQDPAYFSRTFAEEFGISPSDFLKK